MEKAGRYRPIKLMREEKQPGQISVISANAAQQVEGLIFLICPISPCDVVWLMGLRAATQWETADHTYITLGGNAIILRFDEKKSMLLYQTNNNRNVRSCLHRCFYLILNYKVVSHSIMAWLVLEVFSFWGLNTICIDVLFAVILMKLPVFSRCRSQTRRLC